MLMPMRLLIVLVLLISMAPTARADHHEDSMPAKLALENLMRASLEGVEGTEVIVSRVTIPPNTELPRHWHPGEEFAYVIEGSVTLWQEGEDDIVMKAGGVGKVPLRKVHTAMTGDEGCELIVFRVHAHGEPGRVLVDEGR
jgi:quercetin dioxygenase-like cupin family protein